MKPPPNLKKRGRIWHGRWIDGDGRKRSKALGPDMREAARDLAELARKGRRQRLGIDEPDAETAQVRLLADAYVADLRGRTSERHAHDVEVGLRAVHVALEVEAVGEITMARVVAARAVLAEGRAARTTNKLGGYLISWLRWCVLTGRIRRMPVDRWPRVQDRPVRRRQRLTTAEAARLQDGAEEAGIGDLVAIVLGTGFRLSEALALEWRDFDGVALTVRRSKNGDPRTNRLPAALAARLKALRARQGAILGRLPQDEDRIVLAPRGGPLDQRRAHHRLRAAMAAAKLPPRTADGAVLDWHSLRHSYCTWLREAGVDLGTAAVLMGHRSLAMTQRVYSDVRVIPQGAAVAALGALMDAGRTQAKKRKRKA